MDVLTFGMLRANSLTLSRVVYAGMLCESYVFVSVLFVHAYTQACVCTHCQVSSSVLLHLGLRQGLRTKPKLTYSARPTGRPNQGLLLAPHTPCKDANCASLFSVFSVDAG